MSGQIVMFGAPGAGKGTQAAKLEAMLNIPHISTGDMFRYHIKNQTDLGRLANSYIEKGSLVPDDVTIATVRERLSHDDIKKGFLLDGFPRAVPQAEALDGILDELRQPLDHVINLTVNEDEIHTRLKLRGEIENRVDDSDPEIIQHRIETYKEQTAPCLHYYEDRGILRNIYGIGSIDEVFARVRVLFE